MTQVLFPCPSRQASSCDFSVAICLPFSVLVLFFSSAVEEQSVYLSLSVLPLWWRSSLSTCLCVCSSFVVEEQSVYLPLLFLCGGGTVCLPVFVSVLPLWWRSSLSTCLCSSSVVEELSVYLSLCLFFLCGGGAVCLPVSVLPLWWRLTMCCVSSLQSSQGGGHRTLLYGHAILLRHYHSSMVRTH